MKANKHQRTTKLKSISHILLVLLMGIKLNAQTDSLLKVLKLTNDASSELYHAISKSYLDNGNTKSIDFALKAIEKAKKENDKKNIANAYFLMGQCLEQNGKYQDALKTLQRAYELFEDNNDTENMINALNYMGYTYKNSAYYTEALKILEKALEKAKETNYDIGISNALNYKGSVYWNMGQYNTAKDFYNLSLDLRKKINKPLLVAESYNNLALVYKEQGAYNNAFTNHTEALNIYKNNNAIPQVANTYNLIGSLYFRWNFLDSAMQYYLKAKDIYTEKNDQKEIGNANFRVASVYQKKFEGDSALNYYYNSLDIFTELDDSALIAQAYYALGSFMQQNRHYTESIEYYKKARQINQKTNNKTFDAKALQSMATVYGYLNQFNEAFDSYQESLTIFEEIGDKNKTGFTYLLIGNLYRDLDTLKALENYNKSIEIFKTTGNRKEIARCLTNIARMSYHKGKTMDAFIKFQEVDKLYTEMNDQSALSSLHNEVGNLYMRKENTVNAKKHYLKAINYGEAGKNLSTAALCHKKVGDLFIESNNAAEALKHANQAIDLCLQINNQTVLMDAYLLKYKCLKQIGNLAMALDSYEKYAELNETLGNNVRMQEISRYKIKLREDQMAIEKTNAENKLAILELQNSKQNNIITLLIIISALTVILIVITFNRYKSKKKTAEKLLMLNATKDKFFSIIAHDLRNPLNGIMGISEMITKDKSMPQTKMREFISLLFDSSKQLNSLLENLLNWARSQTNRIKFEPNSVSIKKIIDENVLLFTSNVDEKNIVLTNGIKGEPIVYADKEMITTVIRNLISNAIKFTPQGGKVMVITEEKGNKLEITVHDSGVGISKENLKKLFRIESTISTKGTSNEEGTGLGLILCKEFVERNNGEIWVESSLGKGSDFKFTLPLFGKR